MTYLTKLCRFFSEFVAGPNPVDPVYPPTDITIFKSGLISLKEKNRFIRFAYTAGLV